MRLHCRPLGRLATIFALSAGLVGGRGAVAATPADLPALFPGGALAYVEVCGLDAKLDELRASEFLAAVLASPQYQRYEESADYHKLQAVLLIAERQLGCDVWTTAETLLGGNVAVGVYPKEEGEGVDVLVVLRTPDAEALAELRERLDPLLVLATDGVRMTETLEGVERLSFPDDAAMLAWKGDWLALATSDALLDEAVQRLTSGDDEQPEGLVDDESFQSMTDAIDWDLPARAAGKQRLLRAYVDVALLNKATEGRLAPEKLANPLGSLLFGDVVALLRTSPFVAATVDVDSHGAALTASVARDAESMPEPYQAFAPAEGPGVSPPPGVPDLLGAFTIYRDFAGWYVHREDLLQEQVLPGFDKFETGLANLLPGRDVGEDVLPLFGKRFTFVAAPQDYSHLDGEPGLKLPGMAIIVEMAEPDEAAALLQMAFQTIAVAANFEAGQQGRQPWVVTSQTYHDVQVSYAEYLQKPSGEELGVVFNFLPASARVGDQFVLSTSLTLCKQLVDELGDEGRSDGDAPPQTVLTELHFDTVAMMLQSNAEFIKGRIVQDGRTTEEAEAEFAALLDLVRRLDSLQATTQALADVFQLRVVGTWK
jgi:hypothetical protein